MRFTLPMRGARRWCGGLVVLALSSSSGIACVDLFHSTDFGAAVIDDASAEPEVTDGGDAASIVADASDAAFTDFCAWSRDDARSHAIDTCIHLAACELPFGNNAPGRCVEQAILAFDCTAAPNRKVRGLARVAWTCLANAKTCSDFDACLFPPGQQNCDSPTGAAFASCARENATRVDCTGANAKPRGESCIVRGQTCAAATTTEASCAGGQGLNCVSGRACDGTRIQDCDVDASIDLGIDCASFGAGTCTSTSGGPPAACLAELGPHCAPTPSVTCAGTTAVGCPSGIEERVDCSALGVGCDPAASGRDWDVARACTRTTPPKCSADECSPDSTDVMACVKGASLSISCSDHGLGSCRTIPTIDGLRATCTTL